MNQQIICSICFIVVVLISAVTPQTGGGPGGLKPGPIGRKPIPCNAPDRAIVTSPSTSRCGAYPTNDINKYLARSSNKAAKRRVNSVKKTPSAFCKPYIVAVTESALLVEKSVYLEKTTDLSKWPIHRIEAEADQPGTRGPRWPGWTEAVCPSWRRYYRFPTCVIHLGQICFVLRPWVNLECQYTRCRQTSCNNIIRPPPFKVYQCRHTNYRTVIYYIWCPKLLNVYRRYISLPQCCSCMSRWCGIGR